MNDVFNSSKLQGIGAKVPILFFVLKRRWERFSVDRLVS